jgi:hypothetical protein
MADAITDEDRAAIAAYKGSITKVPDNARAFESAWCPKLQRLINTGPGRLKYTYGSPRRSDSPRIKARRRRVAELHAQGMSVLGIAAKMGVSKTSVQGDHKALGLEPNNTVRKDDLTKAIADARLAGMNLKDMRAKFGLSNGALYWHLSKVGLTIKRHSKGSSLMGDEMSEVVRDYHTRGFAVDRIATLTMLARDVIVAELNAMGLNPDGGS